MGTIFNSHSLSPHAEGFTLVELLIAIAVLAVLLALAAPSFKTMVMNNRVSAQSDALATSLNYARNTALSQNVSVIACPYAAAGSTTCGTSWQNGWIIASQPSGGTAVLLQANNTGPNDPVVSSTATSVTFDSRGIATTQAYFTVCDSRGGTYARSVEVLPTGFVQSGSTMGSAAWNGGALTCP